jgi:Putative adhesin
MTTDLAIALLRPAALLLAALPLAAVAGTPINKRTAADPAGTVEISNIAGTVTVSGWNRNEVEITGELGKGVERLDFTKGDKITRIKVVLPERSHNVEDTDLIVKVPLGSALSVNTVSADIVAQGVKGAQRVQSVSGDVRTEASGEDIECRTVSGDVNIAGSGQTGLVSITTVSGDATATRVAGEVNGNTVSGNFSLGIGELTRSRLRSTSGDLAVSGQLAPDARVDIESISGDIRLDLQPPVAAEFEVSSFNGDIRNCFGPKPVRTDEYAPGREWRHKEGAGGARVRIKTLNGDVGVCRK